MQLSSNYQLKLPEGTDNVKRQDFVDNFSKIDSVMKEHDTSLSELANLNLLINGDFSQWQRGNTFTTGLGYTADRWFVWSSGTPTITNVSNWGLQIASTGNDNVMQAIPPDAILNNGNENKMIFSAWITSDSTDYSNVKLHVFDSNSMTSGTEIASKVVQVNNNMKSFLELAIPAYMYTGNIKVSISFSDSTCTGKKFTITKAKLEYGDNRTPFVPRLYAEELALCQRYFETGNFYCLDSGLGNFSGYSKFIPYKVQKRVAPTVTTNDGSTTNKISLNTGSWTTGSNKNLVINNVTGFAQESNNGCGMSFSWIADAEIY